MEGFFWGCMGFVIGCFITEAVEKYKKRCEDKINNLNKENK
tara:strand:+ start:148 stop:270 length:123 start_codon:yes stop_codon:yes gene_type:complete